MPARHSSTVCGILVQTGSTVLRSGSFLPLRGIMEFEMNYRRLLATRKTKCLKLLPWSLKSLRIQQSQYFSWLDSLIKNKGWWMRRLAILKTISPRNCNIMVSDCSNLNDSLRTRIKSRSRITKCSTLYLCLLIFMFADYCCTIQHSLKPQLRHCSEYPLSVINLH